MSAEHMVTQAKPRHHGRPYRDQLGLAHEGLSHTAALQVRNHNLVTQLTEALEENARLKAQLRGEHRPAND